MNPKPTSLSNGKPLFRAPLEEERRNWKKNAGTGGFQFASLSGGSRQVSYIASPVTVSSDFNLGWKTKTSFDKFDIDCNIDIDGSLSFT